MVNTANVHALLVDDANDLTKFKVEMDVKFGCLV